MNRHAYLWSLIGLLFLSSLACNAFSGTATEPALTLPPLPTAVIDLPTVPVGTIAPTATLPGDGEATPSPTPLSDDPQVRMLVDLNVRSGPGVQYDRVSFMLSGETALVLGVDPNSGWWKIECPPRNSGLPQCWVSGGAQYTVGSNVQAVTVAQVPPTPTPPPTAVPAGGVLAYADGSGLWVARLDLDSDPPTADPAVQIAAAPDIQQILIAPDGAKIAYLAGDFTANALSVINKDGSGQQLLVDSRDLPIDASDVADFAVLIGQIEWLADNQTLAFNTNIIGLTGPGFGPQEDLWTVTTTGALTERIVAGEAGGAFAINNNVVLLSDSSSVVRLNLDGSNQETVLSFPGVNTAAGYTYYPDIGWYNGVGLASVSSPDPFFEEAPTAALWQIPVSGEAIQLSTIPGLFLQNPPRWSPDGSRLAYITAIGDAGDLTPQLTLTDGEGQNPFPYSTRDNLRLFDWSPDNRHFLFAAADFFAVGRVGDPAQPITFPTGTAVPAAQWVDGDSFVFASGSGTNWTVSSGNLTGTAVALVSVVTDGPPQFAVQGR